METPWYKTVNTQAVFSAMRKIDADSLRYDEQCRDLQPQGMAIAVGSAFFDPFLKSESRRAFLSALRKGADPQQAGIDAKAAARYAIEQHNKKRPKDANWGRWEGSADADIDRLVSLVKEMACVPVAPGP